MPFSGEVLAALEAEYERKTREVVQLREKANETMRLATEALEERNEIGALLKRYQNGSSPAGADAPLETAAFSGRFEHDPNSKTMRMLHTARAFLIQHREHKATFLDLYAALPDDLKATNNAREAFRTALVRSGGRVGIQYVSAEEVRVE